MFIAAIKFIEIYSCSYFVSVFILTVPGYFDRVKWRRGEGEIANKLTFDVVDINL